MYCYVGYAHQRGEQTTVEAPWTFFLHDPDEGIKGMLIRWRLHRIPRLRRLKLIQDREGMQRCLSATSELNLSQPRSLISTTHHEPCLDHPQRTSTHCTGSTGHERTSNMVDKVLLSISRILGQELLASIVHGKVDCPRGKVAEDGGAQPPVEASDAVVLVDCP